MMNTKGYKEEGKTLKSTREVSKKLDYLEWVYNSSAELDDGETFHMLFIRFLDKYFKDDLRNPEFTYWFLKYNANQMLKEYITTKKFKYKMSSKTKLKWIESELNKIYKIEKSVGDLESEGKLHDFEEYKDRRGYLYTFNKDIPIYEVSRILNNYYQDHVTEHDYTVIRSFEVKAYFRHILLKSYLKSLLVISDKTAFNQNSDYEEIERKSKNKTQNIEQNILQSIWLPQSKISVEDFLRLGVEKGIWNDKNQIITQKGSLYGTGKTLLGSLAIALKGFAINKTTDYKEVGKVFCKAFNVNINEKTKEPYKAFSSGNPKLILEFKRQFNITYNS